MNILLDEMRVKHWVTWQRKASSSRPGFPRSSRAAAGLDVPGCREGALEVQQKAANVLSLLWTAQKPPCSTAEPSLSILWHSQMSEKPLSQRMNSLGVPAGNKTTLSVWNSNSSEGKEAFRSTKYWGLSALEVRSDQSSPNKWPAGSIPISIRLQSHSAELQRIMCLQNRHSQRGKSPWSLGTAKEIFSFPGRTSQNNNWMFSSTGNCWGGGRLGWYNN